MQSLACTLVPWGHSGSWGGGEEAPSESKFLVYVLPHSIDKEIEAGSCVEPGWAD